MPDWKTICGIDDIAPLGARRVAREKGGDVALFRTAEGEVFALLDRCPHRGGPLSQGIVFGLDDGRAKAPDEGCTPSFAVKIEGGQVLLDARELATLGIDRAGDG